MIAEVCSHEGASFPQATNVCKWMEDDCHTLFQGSWKWGPDGHGAILLVNCDCERTYWKKPDHDDDRISRVSGLNGSATFFFLLFLLIYFQALAGFRRLRPLRLIFAFQMSSAKKSGPVSLWENLGAAVCAGSLQRFTFRFVLLYGWFNVVTSQHFSCVQFTPLLKCGPDSAPWKNETSVSFGGCEDLKDMSTMVLRTRGPAKLPDGYKLAMHISQGDAESIRVFRPRSNDRKCSTFGE